jgi:HemK-related putative methylase
MIYEPAEDSFLLRKVLEKEVKHANSVLEIGVGSGYLSEYLDSITKDFVGVDINPQAIQETEKKIKGKVIESNLFEKVPKKKYDIIVFNPPYLPKSAADGEEALATVGGKHGYEVIVRFISELSDFLDPKGAGYLLFSSLSKPEIIFKELEKNLYMYEKVAETSIMLEQLFVYKITPNKTLRKLIPQVKKIRYLSKGKRSYVFRGIYDEETVAIKILSDTTGAKKAIVNESKNLKHVNVLGIGPKLLKQENNYVIMEYVVGEQFQKYWLHASKGNLKKVILEIVRQCHVMDTYKFQKLEMTRPYKHVLIGNKVTLIDFERGTITKDPINVTQFLQFLHSSSFSRYIADAYAVFFRKSDFISLAKMYKQDRKIDSIVQHIHYVFR